MKITFKNQEESQKSHCWKNLKNLELFKVNKIYFTYSSNLLKLYFYSKVETKQTQGLTQLQRTNVILRFFFTFPTKHTNKQTHKQTKHTYKQNTHTNKTHKQKKNFLIYFLGPNLLPIRHCDAF